MDVNLNELMMFGGGGLLAGIVLMSVIWSVVSAIGRKNMNQEQEHKQKVMAGLDRSCEGIESFISSVDIGEVDLSRLKGELVRRVSTLHSRLEEFADDLEEYFVRYIMLRIEGYAQVIDKIDDFGATIGKYGNSQAEMLAEQDTEMGVVQQPAETASAPQQFAAAPPTAESTPAAPAVEQPAAVEPTIETPVAQAPAAAPVEPPEQPIEQNRNDEAPIAFDMPAANEPEQTAPDLSAAPTMEIPVPSFEEEPQAPPPPPQPQAAPQSEAVESDDDDDDAMFGQTMQFSMQDIEAARADSQPQPQQPPQPRQPLPGADPMGQTVAFNQNEPTPRNQSPTPPPPQKKAKKGDGDEDIINGDDLMDQMDSFFSFGE